MAVLLRELIFAETHDPKILFGAEIEMDWFYEVGLNIQGMVNAKLFSSLKKAQHSMNFIPSIVGGEHAQLKTSWPGQSTCSSTMRSVLQGVFEIRQGVAHGLVSRLYIAR